MEYRPDPPLRGLPRIPGKAELPPVPRSLWALVAIMAAIELALSLADAGLIGNRSWRSLAILVAGFYDPIFDGRVDGLWPGQGITMLVTHAFLHGDMMHFLLNNVILLAVGKLISGIVGPLRMLLLFAITAVAGALFFGMIAQTDSPMVGASGAVFGFIGFWKQAEFRLRVRRGLSLRPIWSLILALTFANVVVYVMLSGLVAWEAHLGGFIAGWAVSWIWRPVSRDGAALREPPRG